MLTHTLPISLPLAIQAEPLTPQAFSPFGSVLTNPAPEKHPQSTPASALPPGYGAVSANQGTAIQYRALAPPLQNLYDQAPSRKRAEPRTTMFVCAARQLLPDTSSEGGLFEVKILERHPFTSQTFVPLGASASTRYLVIVAPSLAPSSSDEELPVPEGDKLPGRGLPDIRGLRAFVATGNQAVTYGAGTWHAPMAALGTQGSAIDFVVVQFADDEPVEDCQEVAYEAEGGALRIVVRTNLKVLQASLRKSFRRVRRRPISFSLPSFHLAWEERIRILESTDVKNKLEDLSGVVLKPGENPYNALIEACDDDPAKIQTLYAVHRVRRNAQQRDKFLASDFKELIIDPYLLRLENPQIEPGFDERYCMTYWGRPPIHILELAEAIQKKLQAVAPNIWLMPPHRMHITTLELAFSRTAAEINTLKQTLASAIPKIASYTHTHRARLVKPMVSYDLSAFALSFVPASGEPPLSPPPVAPDVATIQQDGDGYTYHHLRRDMWALTKDAGVEVSSRYVVPSAHVTLGRYLSGADHATAEQRRGWVDAIDAVNRWLEAEVWDGAGSGFVSEWVVGQEKGLDVRAGTLWYGGGRTVLMGEGF
ncbi:hypothetical protein M426DRAFT_54379 [Hypoxylon sp. CI-4A]|nr:hypothetical protein M426DRAFT_54379 [Hypoxylon sp. CI-4A]